jgi:hypothetical protein
VGQGYDDIADGTSVTLWDESGDVIGATALGNSGGRDGLCEWHVCIYDVPDNAKFYTVAIGERGEITKSAEELAKANYPFDVTLG